MQDFKKIDSLAEEQSPEQDSRLADHLLHFFRSLGQPSEAELYLRLFRELPSGSFALLVPTTGVLSDHAMALVDQLKFIRRLGLYPSLLVGAVDLVGRPLLDRFVVALEESGFAVTVCPVSSAHRISIAKVDAVFPATGSPAQGPNALTVYWAEKPTDVVIRQLAEELRPRKLVFLRRQGGLGPHGGQRVVLSDGHFLPTAASGIGVINLREDGAELGRFLSASDRHWLARCASLLTDGPLWAPRATISIASPLSLLRELFTVKGDGTLVKKGALIERSSGYGQTDQARISELLNEAFGRKVKPSFFQRSPHAIYVEQDFRGTAILEPGAGALFLSKFGVLPVARGEGLGQDLWWALCKETPSLYLRARPGNPITAWYAAVCDGLHRSERWNVYWRGIDPSRLPAVIEDALGREEDFESSMQPISPES